MPACRALPRLYRPDWSAGALLGCDARAFSYGAAHGVSQSLGGSPGRWLSSGAGVLALGHGGLLGIGLGKSQQKLFYLPEAHTDFIFAVIGEELGLLGAVVLIALFVMLLWRVLHIAVSCNDPFGTYLGLGIFVLLSLQIVMNLCVVIGLMPTKGLPLPLISLGGSNLLVSLMAIGTMLNMAEGGRS